MMRTARILSVDEEGTELPGKIYLFQGLPKQEKMELIVQEGRGTWCLPGDSSSHEAFCGEIRCQEGRDQDPPLEYHCGERSQAVQTDRDPGSDRGDVGKKRRWLMRLILT